jgi:hypothetical protein
MRLVRPRGGAGVMIERLVPRTSEIRAVVPAEIVPFRAWRRWDSARFDSAS